jgi:hypothetical protein
MIPRPFARLAAIAFVALLTTRVVFAVPVTQRFDLSDGSDQLWSPREVDLKDGTVLQSFAFDNTHQFIYTVQVTEGSAATAGNLTVTKLSWDGQTVAGYMYLTGFGHGVQIGVEPSGSDAYLWTEVDAVSDGTNTWGNKLGRFKFVSGTTLAHTSSIITKYSLVSGATNTTCNVDMVNGYLILRYKLSGSFRFALYSLASVKAGGTTALCDIAQLSDLGTFQGFTSYGSFLYILAGDAYDDTTNPSPGNTYITILDLNTGLQATASRPTPALPSPTANPKAWRSGPPTPCGACVSASPRKRRRTRGSRASITRTRSSPREPPNHRSISGRKAPWAPSPSSRLGGFVVHGPAPHRVRAVPIIAHRAARREFHCPGRAGTLRQSDLRSAVASTLGRGDRSRNPGARSARYWRSWDTAGSGQFAVTTPGRGETPR